MKLTELECKQLIDIAMEAKEKAYVPYFGFHVGAALLDTNDITYTGCNIEGVSFGVTVCAERTAFYKAVTKGVQQFKAIAVVSDSEEIIYPCGICRQVMCDFVEDDFIIICGNCKKEYIVTSFGELMPNCRIPI